MASWEGKSKGTKTGYRIFVWVLRHLGVRPAYFLLRFVSFYYFLVSWKTSRAAPKASARSAPMPTAWLPWPGKVNAIVMEPPESVD